MWKKILAFAQRIVARRRLVIQKGISARGAGYVSSTSMAAVTSKKLIHLPAFSRPKITVRSARWYSFSEIRAGNDPIVLKVIKSIPRLLCVRASCTD
jgi:hypothetical protein